MENILNKLRLARNEKGYSQEYMAEKLDISQKSYCKIENGCTNLSVTRLKQIAYILNLDLSGILI
ncbi:MAG: helix-turn-helix transcriptional regulator [Flavobacteriaceae bacterium]|nr:helix-turn-helix transcriptional regulator [Flavobacteriaceae bacterium]